MAPDDPARRVLEAVRQPDGLCWFRAPGRVNLIGDHTDYNEGFVLPAAIGLECVIAAAPRNGSRSELRSLDPVDDGWRRYVDGVAAALAERGRPAVAVEGVLASSVPVGSGLSSSAALAVALGLSLCAAAGFELAPTELALACQRGEHLATGVPSGIMDQLTSVAGRAGHALLIDCRSLAIRPVAIPDELALVVIHSGLPRRLEASAYAERRASCERIARSLGLRSLRDARAADVRDEPLARHVVSENERVLAAAAALERGDAQELGRLFLESHASLREDYRVSTPELDALVDALVAAGAHGARLTGAGFGGCVVGIAPRQDAERVLADAASAYGRATGHRPRAFLCEASSGAGPMAPPSAVV